MQYCGYKQWQLSATHMIVPIVIPAYSSLRITASPTSEMYHTYAYGSMILQTAWRFRLLLVDLCLKSYFVASLRQEYNTLNMDQNQFITELSLGGYRIYLWCEAGNSTEVSMHLLYVTLKSASRSALMELSSLNPELPKSYQRPNLTFFCWMQTHLFSPSLLSTTFLIWDMNGNMTSNHNHLSWKHCIWICWCTHLHFPLSQETLSCDCNPSLQRNHVSIGLHGYTSDTCRHGSAWIYQWHM